MPSATCPSSAIGKRQAFTTGTWISPRILSSSTRNLETYDTDSNTGARCAVYGQFGVTFTRDSRSRVFAELRVAQNVIGFNNDFGTSGRHSYYPTEFALQAGIGW